MDTDLSLITSYNLLAFAGNGLADDEITDELGVIISSIDETKKILENFPDPKPLTHSPSIKQKKLIKSNQINEKS